ncbi:hypothetical protein FRB97_005638 [Tulasnella sp. 331]|nr:hypothetical protein FRB97_005638 [Tulasnella sp. 331]
MWARVITLISLAYTSIFNSFPATDVPDPKRTVVSERFGASLRFVENSGICETTPGVHAVSGYIDIGNNQNYFFWFFSSRQAVNASTSPFVLWFNGEHGPCMVNSDQKTTAINPNSWNEVANVLYIDQPIGAGFSHGNENAETSPQAASLVWVMLQTFFETFPTYQGRELIFATESYGGHYGPEFVSYFDGQNDQIRHGIIPGEIIIVSAFMLNNGWIDPATHFLNYPGFAEHPPGYTPIATPAVVTKATSYLLKSGGCMDQIARCSSGGSNKDCVNAYIYCTNHVYTPCLGDRSDYDIRTTKKNPVPPPWEVNYLRQKGVQKAIGAEVKYSECNQGVAEKFLEAGDFMRSELIRLGALANSKLKMLIWYGDADYICNWVGGLTLTLEMQWYGQTTFGNTPFEIVTINGVGAVGEVVNVDNFSFM